jgi:hypothetical protein
VPRTLLSQQERKEEKNEKVKKTRRKPLWTESSSLDDELLLDIVDHCKDAIELGLVVVGRGGWDECSSRDDKLGIVVCLYCVVDGGISGIVEADLCLHLSNIAFQTFCSR